MEQFGAKSQKSDYFPSDARLLCPQDPVVRRNVKFKVYHAVRQRGRHPVGNGLVLFAVARRYDTPAVGQTVFPDSPVQYKLVTGGLNQWRRSVQFIKEDDALFRIVRSRKKSGRTPLRASVFKTGKPSEIDGIEQNRTDITQGHAAIRSDFGHNLAFAHARCAPEKYRLVSGKKRMER